MTGARAGRGVRGALAARRAAAAAGVDRPRGRVDRDRRARRLARPRGRAPADRRSLGEHARAIGRSCPTGSGGCSSPAAPGAGMAAVYNVPLGGALFALEVLLGTLTLPLVLPALATSADRHRRRLDRAATRPQLRAPALRRARLAGRVGAARRADRGRRRRRCWIRLIARAHALRPTSASARLLAPIVVFAALGVLAIQYPQLLGNGKPVVQVDVRRRSSARGCSPCCWCSSRSSPPRASAAALPAACSRPRSPTACCSAACSARPGALIWPGAPIGAYAVIGGAAVLAASMQGPLAAIVLVLELTHHADGADGAGAARGRRRDGRLAHRRRSLDLLRPAHRPARRGRRRRARARPPAGERSRRSATALDPCSAPLEASPARARSRACRTRPRRPGCARRARGSAA